MKQLTGAAVRHWDGRKGRILEVDDRITTIEWVLEGSTWITYEEVILNTTVVSEDRLEVLDLSTGWVPLSSKMEAGEPQVWNNIEEAKTSKYSPYKNRAIHDGGPRKKTKKKRGQYRCKCSNYRCHCQGKDGSSKEVKIKKDYKTWYNRIYMDFLQGRASSAKRPGK